MATNIAEHQGRQLTAEIAEKRLEAISAQRAYQLALQVRRGLVKARGARREVLRRIAR